jgi:hypothetical protein
MQSGQEDIAVLTALNQHNIPEALPGFRYPPVTGR